MKQIILTAIKKLLTAISILLITAVNYAHSEAAPGGGTYTVERQMGGDECAQLGGEIINTLSQKDCGANEYLGEVVGMRCPCICCKREEAKALTFANIYTVERIIDGDTLKLANGEIVQLIGIDAPELFSIDGKYYSELEPSEELLQKTERWGVDLEAMDKMGQEATEFIKWLEGKEIELEFDIQERDKYGRLLAYVYSPLNINMVNAVVVKDEDCLNRDEERPKLFWKYYKGCTAHLNATVIKAGYATPTAIPPNVKYSDLFKKLYEEARKHERGLWTEEETKGSFEDFINVPSDETEESKGIFKYIDQNGVKLDTSF